MLFGDCGSSWLKIFDSELKKCEIIPSQELSKNRELEIKGRKSKKYIENLVRTSR